MKMKKFLHQQPCERCEATCLVEDDGRVAYAYVVEDGSIVADLWLYNRARTPAAPQWDDPRKAPFLNPKDYVDTERMAKPITSSKDLEIACHCAGKRPNVELTIRGVRYGVLKRGDKPGATIAAAADGPLAKVLDPPRQRRRR